MPDGSKRVLMIKIKASQQDVTLINTYMPAEGTLDKTTSYEEVLDEVHEIIQNSQNTKIIWIGDMNASLIRNRKSSNDKAFEHFCTEAYLTPSPLMPSLPTYHHFAHSSTSQIDLLVTPTNQTDLISKMEIDARNPENASSHDAVIATIEIGLSHREQEPTFRKRCYCEWKQNGRPTSTASPYVKRMKEAKRLLRSTQRKLAASKRQLEQLKIMETENADRITFCKLVKKQRGKSHKKESIVSFPDPNCAQLDGWATYFEELATPSKLPEFDDEYKNSTDMQVLLLRDICNNKKPQEPISPANVRNHIKSLKNSKAQDIFGISPEHLKYASPEIYEVIALIINQSMKQGKLPTKFKIGTINPLLKPGKPPQTADNYRRITVNSTIGKIMEKEIHGRSKEILKNQQSPLQFGFTEKRSPTDCALILTEAIAEAKDQKSALYITLMDVSKAFDTVDHGSMLVALHNHGIQGSLWGLYADMYEDITSQVKLNGQLSRTITEKQGIRQGAETSTGVYKAKADSLIMRLSNLQDSFRIGSISVGAPTTADDTATLSPSIMGAKTQICIAETDSNMQRYRFNPRKTKVIIINKPKNQPDPEIKLYNSPLEISQQERHLGIERTPDGKATATVKDRIKSSRRATYSLMGAGLHGLNGIGPKVSLHMIELYIIPILTYGLEALLLSDSDYTLLEKYYRNLLRQVQHLPISSAKPAIYLLLGCIPIEAQIHRNILIYFGKIINSDNIEFQVIERQLAMKDLSSNSWTSQIRRLLSKYRLPTAYHLMQAPPSKSAWKTEVNIAVEQVWMKELKEQARIMSTLSLLEINTCFHKKLHPVWDHNSDPLAAHMATVKARLLIQRYPLRSSYCAGKNKNAPCPLCSKEEETVQHFVIDCPTLKHQRLYYLTELYQIIIQHNLKLPSTPKELLALIFNPTIVTEEVTIIMKIEDISRRMIFKLHNERAITLGGTSEYARCGRKSRQFLK